jgi:CBS domain-containing protein
MSTVRDVLDHKGTIVYGIERNRTVFEAIARMAEANIGSLLVVDNYDPVGIFTERDYLSEIAIKGRSSKTTLVCEAMQSPFLYVTPNTPINHCMSLMSARRIRPLPVVDDGDVVGIVSIGDIVSLRLREQEEDILHMVDYIGGRLPLAGLLS